MSLKIGNVLKAIDEGKWVKVPAKVGTFHLKLKQLLPGEQFAFGRKVKETKSQDNEKSFDQMTELIANHIVDWRGLQDAHGVEIPFDEKTLKDKNFINSLMTLTVEGDDEKLVSTWLIGAMYHTDTFAEDDDPDFLAST